MMMIILIMFLQSRDHWCKNLFQQHFVGTSDQKDLIPSEKVEGKRGPLLTKKKEDILSNFTLEAHIQGHEFHQVKTPYEYPYTAIGMITGKLKD